MALRHFPILALVLVSIWLGSCDGVTVSNLNIGPPSGHVCVISRDLHPACRELVYRFPQGIFKTENPFCRDMIVTLFLREFKKLCIPLSIGPPPSSHVCASQVCAIGFGLHPTCQQDIVHQGTLKTVRPSMVSLFSSCRNMIVTRFLEEFKKLCITLPPRTI